MAEQGWESAGRRSATSVPGHDPLGVEFHRLLGGVVLVEVRGAIDHVTAPELEHQLAEASRPSGSMPPRLLLDLSGVSFLDDAGLETLLHLQDRWGANAVALELLAPSSSVVRLLHEADLDGQSWMSETLQDPTDHHVP